MIIKIMYLFEIRVNSIYYLWCNFYQKMDESCIWTRSLLWPAVFWQ